MWFSTKNQYEIILKIAFFSVIFPSIEFFLYDYFISLSQQTYKNFDIILVNENCQNFIQAKSEFTDLNIIEIPPSSSIIKNRERGISWMKKEGYEYIIFGDADDYFSLNRVEVCLNLLDNNKIVFNDLTTFNESGIINDKYLSNRLNKNQTIDFEYIKNRNVLGLSNTAIQSKIVDKDLSFPEELIAFDWAFFSYLMLRNNNKAIFTNEALTYYRQHGTNTIGLQNRPENYRKIIEVKFQHYKFLSKFEKVYIPKMEKYEKTLENMVKIKKEMDSQIKYPLWWEII